MIWILVISVLFFIVNFLISPPSSLVTWAGNKFALHSKLKSNDVTVTLNGKQLDEEEKNTFTEYFNEAYILKRHFIFKGNEQLFLHPETNVTPFVMNVKKDKKDVNFFVYCSEDTIDVVKQHKNKVESYSLSSDDLKKFSLIAYRSYITQPSHF